MVVPEEEEELVHVVQVDFSRALEIENDQTPPW
jgi:hypothetical protein